MTRWRGLLAGLVTVCSVASAERTSARRAAFLGDAAPTTARGATSRTALTRELPSAPREALRVSLGARPADGAVVTKERVVVAAGRELCSIDPRSAEVRRVDLGEQAAHAPVLDARGRAWTLTTRGVLVIVDADGAIVTRRALPTHAPKLRAAPTLLGGALVVAAGQELLVIDEQGHTRAQATLPDAPSIALSSDGARVFAATDLGRVFSWDIGRAPVELPRLGGLPTSAITLTSAGPALVVDGARLVRLGAHAPTWTTLLRTDAGLLEGPIAASDDECVVETTTGTLLGAKLDGAPTRRVDLPSPRAAHPESIGGVGPGPVLDASGRVVFVRGSGELGVVEGGAVTLADKPSCRAPIGLSASSAGVFVTCADGELVGYR
ncbi:MAG: hypothetical protein IT374_01895 [Polyangiaceae bacterium]|nr:hypothetical protein [Polyangiaceae bacterium]